MSLSPLGISLLQQQPIMPAHPGQVAPTNTLGAFQLSTQAAQQLYQDQLQQQLGLWGGLAGIGGAGIVGASKIPAIQNAVSNWISPGSAGSSASAPIDLGYGNFNNGVMTGITGVGPTDAGITSLDGDASSLGSWMSDPAFASLLPSSMGGTAAADWSVPSLGLDASALPTATADAGVGADAFGSVAGDLAADAAPAVAAGTDAAATGGFALADLLPFLFA